MNFNVFYEDTLYHIMQTVEVVDYLDLVEIDYDLTRLIAYFEKYKDFVFSHNQRLLICNPDTDYYPSWDSVGNNIFNVVQIIANFNISTDHIIILNSNFSDRFVDEINYLCDINNLSPIQVIDTSLWYNYAPSTLKNIDIVENKKNLFCFLNGISRTHRKTMLSWLAEYDLLDYGNISWHVDYQTSHTKSESSGSDNIEFLKELRTTYPKFTRINESLGISKEEKQLHVKYNSLLNKTIRTQSIVGVPNSLETRWRAEFLQESLIYLISETVGNYPHVYLSEKTWKTFASKMPFMLAGAKHSLKILQDKGFKTFHNIWDESYDNIPDFYNRAKAIAEQLKWLQNQDYNKILNECIPILEHNYIHLKQFRKKELSNLIQRIKK